MAYTPTLAYDVSRLALPALIRHAQRLQHLNERLHQNLPSELHLPFQIVRLEPGVAVLQTTSPVWATRLRYQTPELLTHLSRIGEAPVTTIRILVRPANPAALTPTTASRPELSAAAANCLLAAAEHLTDAELAGALVKLANRALSTEPLGADPLDCADRVPPRR